MLVDTHCHLTHERFHGDRSAVLVRASEAGVAAVVTVASSAKDAGSALTLAREKPGVWGTAGIHPHESGGAQSGDMERIAELLAEDEIVAVGETGLDFHYDFSPRPLQRELFRRHVELAHETRLPLVVHSRSADEDTASAIQEAPAGVRGVLHCYSGGKELLETALEAGWFISFTGLVTFRNFSGVDLLRAVPRDRLMVETDAPYLAPVPYRGKRNEPAHVTHVCQAVARHRGEKLDVVAEYTTRNAARFFGLPIEAQTSAGE